MKPFFLWNEFLRNWLWASFLNKVLLHKSKFFTIVQKICIVKSFTNNIYIRWLFLEMMNILVFAITYLVSVVRNIFLTFNTTKYSEKILNVVAGQSSNWYMFPCRDRKKLYTVNIISNKFPGYQAWKWFTILLSYDALWGQMCH